MPRVNNVRERQHQFYYDTLIRAEANNVANPVVTATTRLFATGNFLGLTEWTNMKAVGQLPSDETFLCLAIRVWLWYVGAQALMMYQLSVNQIYLKYFVGDKCYFQGPCWTMPAGGGIFGFDSATPAMVNGVPQSTAILLFGKAVAMPARQSFYVEVTMYDLGNTSLRTQFFNTGQTIGHREVKVFIDGLHTRDVQ